VSEVPQESPGLSKPQECKLQVSMTVHHHYQVVGRNFGH